MKKPRRFSTSPTKLGGVSLAFAVFFFMIGTNIASGWLLSMAALCLAVPSMSLVRSLAGVRGIDVRRDPICRGEVGGEMRYQITVGGGRLSQAVLRDGIVGASPVLIASLPRGFTAVAEVRAVPQARGLFEDPPIVVECAAPLGMWITRRRVACTGSIEISPPLPPISVPWRAGGDDPLADGLTDPPRKGAGLDFMGLREYRPGDPPRHIHWGSSAKRDDLIVREFQQEGIRPIVVIPDLRIAGPHTDRALSIAGAIVRNSITNSIPVWLVIPGGEILDSPSLGRLRAALARAQIPTPLPDPRALAQDRRIPPNPLMVIISPPNVTLPEAGAHAVHVVIGEPVATRQRVWWCPLEGDACLTASSTASAA